MRNKRLFFPLISLHSVLLLLPIVIFTTQLVGVNGSYEKRFYIVYLGDRPVHEDSTVQTHIHVLSSVKRSYAEAKESMVYSYTKSFNAFAAKLSSDEANKLSQMEEVLSVIPNRYRKLHTTRSWDFIGLPLTARRKFKRESDIIVGVFDTGITPESESFKDDGFGPPPAKWKGTCDRSANFSGCNNKIVGARYFKLDGNPDPADASSPLDLDGHGTHTSSTAAGEKVSNASLFGLAKGTARGAVPSARVAMYKVCWISFGCADMDILAAFDAAIHDGVDVISISIGGGSADYVSDSIAVGAFHAMKKGIITVASAGNDGPSLSVVTNHAPWLVTVAASGIDRTFRSQVQLGNGKSVSGIGISTFNPKQKQYPIVSGADVAQNSDSKEEARFCFEEALDPKKVKGKLVLCVLANWGTDAVVKGIGGAGTIVESDQFLDAAQIFMAPATLVNSSVGETINSYINSTRAASAVIYRSKEEQVRAPFIASFSSRGPNPGSIRVLKPDIAAPGVDILASYTPLKSLTGLKGDTQFSKFTIMSGTSMSCPHVAGIAAYVKSFHPKWSPAAIRSAILTTAKPMSRRVNPEGEFAYGAGQVTPRRALSPGLVYDMNDMSYIQFLCLEGFNGSSLAPLVGSKSINCSSLIPGLGYDALNYPTFQLTLNTKQKTTVGIYRRTVTNVGQAKSVYNATVKNPKGVEITVTPPVLSFSRTLQKRSFKVVVKANQKSFKIEEMVSGYLAWKSPRHVVRSPIVVYSPYVQVDQSQINHIVL
ncbi:Subtilase [Trema orientale]|uniref:Subtilase n=1 Tax=Trema orientale TaxID=63057 RepID=A0A2P5EI21_TREOI|nr:Subtilase [Trema orientale]